MTRSVIAVFLSGLLSVLPASGQAVLQGHVADENGIGLESATVVVVDLSLGTATDSTGRFMISGIPEGSHVVQISMIGFQSQEHRVDFRAGRTAQLSVELKPADYFFDQDVVVTATRTEQSVATAPASVSIVSGRDLSQRPVGDLTDAIRDLPGISLSAGSQGRRSIQIRGMESNYTLILVDGKRINSSEAVFRHNDFDIGLLPIESIERIEVVRGGMSTLYGSEALGGVINVITRPAAREWRTSISSELQSPTSGDGGQEYRASVNASGALIPGTLALTLTGGISHRDEWHGWPDAPQLDSSGDPVTRPDGSPVNRRDLATLEGRNDHNGRLKLDWTASDKHAFEAEIGHAYQTRFGEYYISNWGNAEAEVRRSDVVLTHRGEIGRMRSEVRSYAERVTTENDLVQRNLVLEGNAHITTGKHQFIGGAEARWIDLKAPEEFLTGGSSVHQQAVFLQDEFSLTDGIKILGGARLDHHQTFGLHLTPRVYGVFSATEAITFKAGIGTAFKAPTLRQLSDDSVVRSCRGACLIVGSDDLRPETSTNLEASINLDTRPFGASMAVFTNHITNLIDTPRGSGVDPIGVDLETQLPMFVPRNVNQARIRGIETTARVRLGRLGRLTANHTLLDARDLDQDVRLDYRPRHSMSGKVDAIIGDRTAAFLRGQYVGSQTSGEIRLDPYTLFDIGANVELRDELWLNIGVQNVANTRTDDADDNYSFVERGRSVSAGLTARF